MTMPQYPGSPQDTSPQQQWASPDGQQHDYPNTGTTTAWAPASGGKTRKPILIAGAAALAVFVVLGFGGYAVYDQFIREDSGVAACKAMAAGKKMDGSPKTTGGDSAVDKKMTEAEYRKARAIFEESRYEKLREHGTAIVDVAWQMQGLGDDSGMAGLAFMGPLGTHLSGLQSACADQGVIVDLSVK
ncbi:hypothetical protein AB0K20_30095 [Micromonospora matsumotoense]|uniref:hypothetical protein n=1 Tax=Micromonospora matsumotoense TaxID=121616 RepID=UPI0034462342